MSVHTTGPWAASEGTDSDVWHVDMPDRWFSVIVSRHEEDWDMSVEEVRANAHLLAAAPDLLAASSRLISRLANGGELEGLPEGTLVSVPIDDICALAQAITKANGP